MRITFTRTGDRRYRVVAERERAVGVVVEPAPGFDAHLPHDLVHFLVERHWGLRTGICVDLAAGGDAGTFRPLARRLDRREAGTREGLATSGAERDRSEVLSAAVFAAWQSHAGHVAPGSEYVRNIAVAANVTLAELDAIMPACDEMARRWHALPSDGSLSLEWPSGEGAHRPRCGRRPRPHTERPLQGRRDSRPRLARGNDRLPRRLRLGRRRTGRGGVAVTAQRTHLGMVALSAPRVLLVAQQQTFRKVRASSPKGSWADPPLALNSVPHSEYRIPADVPLPFRGAPPQ